MAVQTTLSPVTQPVQSATPSRKALLILVDHVIKMYRRFVR
jgi:hypothetical protein